MADAAASTRRPERPLSPHLQIYRWSVTMFSSIFHRMTGIALGAGTLIVAWWLIATAMGPDAYADFAAVAGHWFGRLVLLGFTVAFTYHLLNGIRHLVWDLGHGFSIKGLYTGGVTVAVLAAVITAVLWYVGFTAGGAA